MASYYVWSGATGSANGTSWANAYTTLMGAFSGKAAGDIFYVAHDHAESSGSIIYLEPGGTNTNLSKVICVNRAGSVPPVSADRRNTAQVATTNTLNFNNSFHYDGIIFISSGNINVPYTGSGYYRFDNCSLRLSGAGGQVTIYVAGSAHGGAVELNNTTLSFANIAQYVSIGGVLRWRNTASALIGSAVPTTLFLPVAAYGGIVECAGVDLSASGSGKTLVGAISTAVVSFKFVDCKLDAAVTKATVPATQGSTLVDFIRSSATGNYAVYSHRYAGLLTEETTVIRTGGSSDGTTGISWNVVTTADCNYSGSFECPPIAIWCDTTGSAKTATVECIGAAVATDQEVWLDLEYLGSSSSPQGSFVNDGKADLLATAAAQTSSSATWAGGTLPPSYSNPGGQGDRTASINVTSTVAQALGTHSMLVNNLLANEYYWTAGQTSKTLTFDFGTPQIINEFTWIQSSAFTHGSAQTFAGSNDNVSYTNFPDAVAIGTSATTVVPITNTTAYRYYRLTIPGATSAAGYIYEIKFKIGLTLSPFKLNVTFTPQMKGWVYARVKVGKASSTFYVDPLVTLT